MAIDFPDSPFLNQEYLVDNRVWIWNGTVWKAKSRNIGLLIEDAIDESNEYADNAISTHALVTENVHGIANVAALATLTDLSNKQDIVSGVSDTEIGYLANVSSDIQDQIDGKAANVHSHSISDVTDLSLQLSGKADSSHTHLIAEVTDLSNTLSNIQDEIDGKANSSHSHEISDVNLLVNALAEKSDISHGHSIEDIANLSDSLLGKSDIGHTHSLSNISDVTVSASEVNLLANASSNIQDQINGKAPSVHSHSISDVSGLQDELDDKALIEHDHTLSDITDVISSSTELNYLQGVTSNVQAQINDKASLSGATFTGFVTLNSDPTQALHAATKEYVDNVSAGIISKPQTYAATTSNLDATYDNGIDGAGATLTANNNGAFPVIDGVQLSTANGFRGILVKNQTNAAQNGRYNLTTLGDSGTPWVLTKCSLCDTADEIPGSYIFVTDGTLYGGTGWVLYVDDPSTFVVGTDPVYAFQFSGSGTITAGTNIDVSGSQVSVSDPFTVASLTTTSSADFSNATITGLSISDDMDDVSIANVSSGDVVVWSGSAWINRHVNEIPAKISTVATSTNHTLSASDAGMIVEINASSNITVSLPSSPDGLDIGTQIVVMQTGPGEISFSAGVGNSLNYDSGTPGSAKLRSQWTAATLLKRATDSWVLYGDLVG
jgi:hypothetical protein